MNVLATILFPIGAVAIAIAFAAHVGHAVLLANGRRSLALAFNRPTAQPAWAGAVSGSFADARLASAGLDPADRTARARPDPARTGRGGCRAGSGSRRSPGTSSPAGSSSVAGRGATCSSSASRSRPRSRAATSFLSRRYPIRSIGFIPTGVALALLLYAASLPSDDQPARAGPPEPAADHDPRRACRPELRDLRDVSFAAGVGVPRSRASEDRFAWLPSHKVLDEVAYRSVIIGFPIFATMIILGSWWASIAWSRYWGWDPKETAALITWLSYAVYLHARNQKSWAGRPAALLLVVAFGMVIVTYSGSLWFNGLHSYSGL